MDNPGTETFLMKIVHRKLLFLLSSLLSLSRQREKERRPMAFWCADVVHQGSRVEK
jgi:hypothetical protein